MRLMVVWKKGVTGIFNKGRVTLLHNKFLKAVVIAGVVALVAISDFFMCSGKAKELPQPESDGTIALAPAMGRGKWGLLDKKGNWFIEPRYLSIGKFSEGIAGVLDPDSKKYGFIDKDGNWVLKPRYYVSPKQLENANSGEISIFTDYQVNNIGAPVFKEGFAVIELGEKNFGFIDKNGKILCSGFAFAFPFENGYARVTTKEGKTFKEHMNAVIDKKGGFAVKPVKAFIKDFSDGYFIVDTPRGKGYWKPYDSDICSPEYFEAVDFSEGLALVWSDEKTPCIIDKNFKVVFCLNRIKELADAINNSEIETGSNMKYKNGRLAVKVCERVPGLSGGVVRTITIDRKGTVVSDVVEGGHAVIDKDVLIPKEKDPGKFGYINSFGEFVIKPQYSLAHKFKNGVAIVEFWDKKYGNKFGLIDRKGNFVKELSDDILVETDCGLIIAGKDGKIGALDSAGKNVVIPYRFEAIHGFKKYKKEDLLLNKEK